ncbi:MAG: hypothetical protein NVS3B17_19500 [Vulcanimicrobiaceae bacterium]
MIGNHHRVAEALRRLAIPQALALVAGPLAAIAAATGIFMTVAIALSAFGAGPRILGS